MFRMAVCAGSPAECCPALPGQPAAIRGVRVALGLPIEAAVVVHHAAAREHLTGHASPHRAGNRNYCASVAARETLNPFSNAAKCIRAVASAAFTPLFQITEASDGSICSNSMAMTRRISI